MLTRETHEPVVYRERRGESYRMTIDGNTNIMTENFKLFHAEFG